METILNDIYNNLVESGEMLKNSKEYKKSSAEASDIYDELDKSMNEEQKKKLSDLWTAEACTEYEVGLAYYKAGFKAGLRISCECLKD